MPIQVLPPQTALKIAAGEVIERPASVVKELIENSIDAGARNIRVEIKNGGLLLIRIADDGVGIPFQEVPVAFERHATSKIGEVEDLYRLHTLGFRGEALPSIAAVSHMTMLTRPRNSEEDGSEITFEGGQPVYHRPAGAPPGTIISVRNLFYNLPARQKWSRSGTSEAGYILNIVSSYALAYPEIKFALTSEGRTLLQTSGSGDLHDAVSKVYGADLAKAMLPLQTGETRVDEDGVILDSCDTLPQHSIRVSGFTGDPSASKPNRNFQQFFVNRRWIQSKMLTYAVQEAYTSLIMTGRFPVCVIQIEIDPAEVDANVHPAKTEVRFLYDRKVFGAVQKAVRNALVQGTNMPAWTQDIRPGSSSPGWFKAFDKIYTPEPSTEPATGILSPEPVLEHQASLELPGEHRPVEMQIGQQVDLMSEPAGDEVPELVENSERITRIAPETPAVLSKPRLPLLRVVGQVSATYLVAEGPDGMYLVDQHAAHERVLYEKFQAHMENRQVESQLLLEPVLVDLTPRQRVLLEDEAHRKGLAELGFQLEPFGDLTFMLRAVPAQLFGRDLGRSLIEMLDEAEGWRDGGCSPTYNDLLNEPDTTIPRTWQDKLAASLACHSAVRAGQILSLEEMRELINQLERTGNPHACAHGRPTMIHLSQGQLEKGFGRK